jgi:hypothetical protein
VENDQAKIKRLEAGQIPIYEPGLEEMVRRNRSEERLTFTTDLQKAVQASEIVFIAVGTPQGEDGSADLQHVLVFPTESNLRVFAAALSSVPTPDDGPLQAIELQVWATHFALDNLQPASELLRAVTVRMDGS